MSLSGLDHESSIEWVPILPEAVRPGDRIAPLASWTLTVLAIGVVGGLQVWVCVNHDTGRVDAYRPFLSNLYVLRGDQ